MAAAHNVEDIGSSVGTEHRGFNRADGCDPSRRVTLKGLSL